MLREGRKGEIDVNQDREPENQELQEEEIAKAYRKLRKKKEKKLSSPVKQFSKNDLDSSNKSEYFLLHDESDVSIEEDIQPEVFTLDGTAEDDIRLTKLCGKNLFFIILQEF